MDHSLGIKRPIASFRSGAHVAKRSRFLENGMKNMEVKVETQPSKGDNIKAMAQPSNLDSREAESIKVGVAAHTRKSNDSPAVVPIKKRRIQILEATRSPSPPPSSPPQQATSPRSIPPELSAPCGENITSLSSSSSLLGFSSASSPRSSVPVPVASTMSQAHLPPASHMPSTKEIEKAEAPQICKLDSKEQPFANLKKCLDDECDISAQQGSIENTNGQVLPDTEMDQSCSHSKSDGQLIRSESDSFSRDDRLHWDLNTDMAAWDASMEQDTIKITEVKYAEVSPPNSPSVDSAGTNQKERCNEDARQHLEVGPEYGEEESGGEKPEVAAEDRKGKFEGQPDTGEEVLEELEAGEHAVNDPEIGAEFEEDPDIGEQMDEEEAIIQENIFKNSEHRDAEKVQTTPPSVHVSGVWNVPNADFPDPSKRGSRDTNVSSDGRDVQEPSETHCYAGDMAERPKPGKQGKLSTDDAEGWNYEPELEEHVDYGDSDCRDVDDQGLDVEDRTSLMQAESNWNGEDGSGSQKDTPCEGEALIAGEMCKPSLSDAGHPTSEANPERHTLSGRTRPTGWDQLPEGFNSAEEALKAAKEGTARRGGRGGSWNSPAGRGTLHSASRFGPSSIRTNTRDGFSSARGDSYYGERHPDEAVYDRDGFRHGRRDDNFNVRGRDPSRRPGIFGRGRAGGWMDSQHSHMSHWGPGRHRPGSGFSGPLNESSGFPVAPDGTGTKHGMGPGRGVIRSTVSGGRVGRGGHTRGPPVDMDGGVHYPLRAGAGADRGPGLGVSTGPGYSGSMHDRSGRGMMDRYRGGGLDSRRSLSPRRQHPLDHPNMMGRMPGMRPDSRAVRSRTPPPIHRPMASSEYNAVRNQRSPPQSSRWSSDKRDAASYQERDFKRPLSRTRVPPQRTSPHVVHGSSLTDERDRQVLAGSRHSPTLKSSVAPTPLRKSKDDSLDARQSKRMEENDARYAGSFAKDGDYRSNSPFRESDREREKGSLYRRDRDRDDERRRDFRRSSSRDGRFPGGSKHANPREADDDVAPRRRRPS